MAQLEGAGGAEEGKALHRIERREENLSEGEDEA